MDYKIEIKDYSTEQIKMITSIMLGEQIQLKYKTLCQECHDSIIHNRPKMLTNPIERSIHKIECRVNGDKSRILRDFIENNWKTGEYLKPQNIAARTGLSTKDIDNLKRNNKYFTDIFNDFKTRKKGVYKKASEFI